MWQTVLQFRALLKSGPAPHGNFLQPSKARIQKKLSFNEI